MTIEMLYPEVANLYGDNYNIEVLRQTEPSCQVIRTALPDRPAFADTRPDVIYMGPMTERAQELVIEALRPYRERIRALIDSDCVFLMTGNAMECLGRCIENEEGSRIEGLGIFPAVAKRKMFNRYNSLYLGNFGDISIVGYKNQFSHMWCDNSKGYFTKTIRGAGLNPETELEGIVDHNFFGTYLLGPLLVHNPLFTQHLLGLLSISQKPAFFEEAMAAYEQRLRELEDTKTKF